MTPTALCHRNPNRAFSDPDNAPDFSIRAALKLCAACPVRTQCARDALHAGDSLDGHTTAPATGVIAAGIICRGDADTAHALARAAGVPTPPHYREKAPRPQLPDGCNHCGRPLHKWTRNPEEIPEGHVMHYAKGWCVKCRGAYKQARNATVTKETPSGLRKQIDRKRHHPETAAARARTLARGEAARAAAAEQGYDLNTREAQALLGRDPRSLTALAQAGHLTRVKVPGQRRGWLYKSSEILALKPPPAHVIAAERGYDLTARQAADLAGVAFSVFAGKAHAGVFDRYSPPGSRAYFYRSDEVAAHFNVDPTPPRPTPPHT
ncbi:MAG: hypothetical protein GXX79_21980, partial [Actinomycetales bacterium]|nr:hypothetical protein [Actinomycetales bacterium]